MTTRTRRAPGLRFIDYLTMHSKFEVLVIDPYGQPIIQISPVGLTGTRCLNHGCLQDYTRCHWGHASSQAKPGMRGIRLSDSGKTGKSESRWKRQRPYRHSDDSGGGEKGVVATWRHDHRAYIWEHGNRPRNGRLCKGLQDDLYNARQDERGEEKSPSSVRCEGGCDTDKREH